MNNKTIKIGNKKIGDHYPTYFIADIAANHDGSISRAKELIQLAAEAGADAAKFQHFQAKSIVSDYGFKAMSTQQSHQASWDKTVFEVYEDASLNLEWTSELKIACDNANIAFFTSPYSFEIVDYIDRYVPAYKIGSGDITWIELVKHIAAKQKPYIMATGASNIDDVIRATEVALQINPLLCLMQCNTNYTASLENFKFIQLNVLRTYRAMYPELVIGLSDHTPGHATVLGAVALGARMIEKHFTDDTSRKGPDHKFSMDPSSWNEMVERTRELELSLGGGIKKIEDNECETVILQRRSIRLNKDLPVGATISPDDVVMLRPCPSHALPPYLSKQVIGKKVRRLMKEGEHIQWTDIE